MTRAVLATIRRQYQAAPGAQLVVTSTEGVAVQGNLPVGLPPRVVVGALAEAQRWGEPCVVEGSGCFLWAVPLTHNALILGALVAWVAERDLFPKGLSQPTFAVRSACAGLLVVAEELNLTNGALLRARRDEMEAETQRAGFLHSLKRGGLDGLIASYLREESSMVSAIRSGERKAGRVIINRLLVGIWHQAGSNIEAVKALLLELVVLMCRTAVDSGSRREVLPTTELFSLRDVKDDMQLARWVKQAMERIFDALETHRGDPDEEAYKRALRWINEHCDEELSRDSVAEAVGVAPARLSRLLRIEGGRGFSDLINRARIDRAKVMLEQGRPALDVALDIGFKDPSYFTKVFRRQTGMTPRDYRERVGG